MTEDILVASQTALTKAQRLLAIGLVTFAISAALCATNFYFYARHLSGCH